MQNHGKEPADFTNKNSEKLWQKLYGKTFSLNKQKQKYKYAVGDFVRITRERHKLSKGYLPSFTTEVFRVKSLLRNREPATYKLESISGEAIDGIFYEPELVRVIPKIGPLREIEKIVKTQNHRTRGLHYLVKWKNEKNPTWIEESELFEL